MGCKDYSQLYILRDVEHVVFTMIFISKDS